MNTIIVIKASNINTRNEILREINKKIQYLDDLVPITNIGVRWGTVFYTLNHIKCLAYRTKTSLLIKELK
jgi:hypothetical protein